MLGFRGGVARGGLWIFLMAWAVTVWADTRESVLGRWADDRSILEITERDGQLRARVIAMEDPVYQQGEKFGPVGAPRRDDLNPDESMRGQPILGIELLSDYRYQSGKWQGRIYDAESGKTYSSNIQVGRNGRLKMRGYIGAPMFGRTVAFEPLGVCAEHMLRMLEVAQLAPTACE
jgi:uncharacterized protein (DUF2147 family)